MKHLALVVLLSVPALAQEGANPPILNGLSLKQYTVEVEATDTTAAVVVKQSFYNSGARMDEADFYFPLPASAAASGLELKMGGRYFGGNLLSQQRARRIYDEITSRRCDPALLDCVGKGLYRCRVFPVPARGTASVRFAYRQTLRSNGAMRELVLPLDAARFNRAPADRFFLKVRVRTENALQAIFCATHRIEVERVSAHEAVITLTARRAYLAGDFVLQYSVEDAPLGAVLASYREPGHAGYFVLSLDAAFAREKQRKAPRDVVIALDTSSSANRNDIDATAVAIADALQGLRPGKDRFALMAFSTEPRVLTGFQHPGDDVKQQVRALFSTQPLAGRTRLGAAIDGAAKLAADGRAGTGVILITDGVETAPGADAALMARDVAESGHRVGLCGVGTTVDTARLATLGNTGRGDSAFPARTRDLAGSVRHLLETTKAVPLTDVLVTVDGASEVYPTTQRMLHPGDSITVAGRYTRSGEITVHIRGRVSGEMVERSLKLHLRKRGGDPAVARMWASRRVGYLLDDAHDSGKPQKHKEEIVSLGRRYGIVTPHTSLLVLEEADQERYLKGMKRQSLMRLSGAGASAAAGAKRRTVTSAVNAQADLATRIRKLKRCDSGAEDPFAGLLGKNRNRMRRAGGSMYYRDANGTWVAATWTGKDTSSAETVVFLSARWKELAQDADVAKVLALGADVVFEHGGKLIHVRKAA